MSLFSSVPVVDVHNENFREMWPTMLLALKTSSYVAIDLELSGLGPRKALIAKSIEDRYKAMCDVACSRSILSMGLSCFKLITDAEGNMKKHHQFLAQTFNITLLCSEDYTVEPASLQFLVDHGFDFNKQYSKGVPYYRGNDKSDTTETQSVRQLFTELILCKSPIVFHNGLVDLVFLYKNLYADLPDSLPSFVADLAEVFSAGIYDTKYIAEFVTRMPASYLEYTFRKSQRDNAEFKSQGRAYVDVLFPSYPAQAVHINYRPCDLPDTGQMNQSNIVVCDSFASHGWCPHPRTCNKSHNIDHILDNESKGHYRKRKKNKRRRKKDKNDEHIETQVKEIKLNEYDDTEEINMDIANNTTETQAGCQGANGTGLHVESIDISSKSVGQNATGNDEHTSKEELMGEQHKPVSEVLGCKPNSNQELVDSHGSTSKNVQGEGQGHRAGFDAFMTGFCFATFIVQHGEVKPTGESDKFMFSSYSTQSFANKLCLSGKDIPLHITKSTFAKTSKCHREKLDRISQLN